MISLMHLLRDSCSLDVEVNSVAMRISFKDKSKGINFEWKLTAYPVDFIRAFDMAMSGKTIANFEVRPDGILFIGEIDNRNYSDELLFLYMTKGESAPEFKMKLRDTELTNLVHILVNYWSC